MNNYDIGNQIYGTFVKKYMRDELFDCTDRVVSNAVYFIVDKDSRGEIITQCRITVGDPIEFSTENKLSSY